MSGQTLVAHGSSTMHEGLPSWAQSFLFQSILVELTTNTFLADRLIEAWMSFEALHKRVHTNHHGQQPRP